MTRRTLRLRARLRLQRGRFERELDVALRFHLDMLTAQHVRAGMPLNSPGARRASIRGSPLRAS